MQGPEEALLPLERTLAHLARLYGASADPWGHLTKPYEREKYVRTLRSLGPRRFGHGLEVGCGIGALSELLASRCERLTCIDCVPSALARARRRLRGLPHVAFIDGVAPGDLPPMTPDLIVLSEVLYFMTETEIACLGAWIAAHAGPQALVVVVTWRGANDEPLSGDTSLQRFARALPHWSQQRTDHDGYRIDRFTST
jgi:predicted TPR repeat methyltransferase